MECTLQFEPVAGSTRSVLPEPRQHAASLRVNATDVATGSVHVCTSVMAVQKALRMSRATVYACIKNGFTTASGHVLALDGTD